MDIYEAAELLPLNDENATIRVKIADLQEIIKANAFYAADRNRLQQTIEKLSKLKTKAEKKLVGMEKDCRDLVAVVQECRDVIQRQKKENVRLKDLVGQLKMRIPAWDVSETSRAAWERDFDVFVEDGDERLDNLAEELEHGHEIEASEDEESEVGDQSDEERRIAAERGVLEYAAELQTAKSRTSMGQGEVARTGKQWFLATTPHHNGGLLDQAAFDVRGNFELPPTPISMNLGDRLKKAAEFEVPPTPISMDSKSQANGTTQFELTPTPTPMDSGVGLEKTSRFAVGGPPIPFALSKLPDTRLQDEDEKSGKFTNTESVDDVYEQHDVGSNKEEDHFD